MKPIQLFPFPFCLVASPVPKIVGQVFSESANVRAGVRTELGFRFSKIPPFCLNLGTSYDINISIQWSDF